MVCVSRHSLWPLLSPPDSCWGSVAVSLSTLRRTSLTLSIRLVFLGTHKYTHTLKFPFLCLSGLWCTLFLFDKSAVQTRWFCSGDFVQQWLSVCMCVLGSCPAWPVPLLKKASPTALYRTHEILLNTLVTSAVSSVPVSYRDKIYVTAQCF